MPRRRTRGSSHPSMVTGPDMSSRRSKLELRAAIEHHLYQASGSCGLHAGPFGKIQLTDGIVELAELGACWWLIDVIASHQSSLRRRDDWPEINRLAIWRLDVFNIDSPGLPSPRWAEGYRRSFNRDFGAETGDASALVTVRIDRDAPVLIEQWIPYTDFPVLEMELYVSSGVLMCPMEY